MIAVVPDAWIVAWSVVTFVGGIILALGVAWLNARQRRLEGMEDRIQRTSDQVIEARMMTIQTRVEGSMKVLDAIVAEMNRRLERGDRAFDNLGERDRKLELKTQEMIAELRQWVVEKAASKSDLASLVKEFQACRLECAPGRQHRDDGNGGRRSGDEN